MKKLSDMILFHILK